MVSIFSELFFDNLYTPDELKSFIDDCPDDFVAGVFSVPAEISTWDEVQDSAEELTAMSDAYHTGRVFAGNWAMKNGLIKINEV